METTILGKWKKVGVVLCMVPMIGLVSCDYDDDENVVTYDNERFFTDHSASNLWEDADLNRDNSFDNDEFNTNAFNMWDMNNDGSISENEWTTATTDFNVNTANNQWTTWDADMDNSLNMQEFQAGYATSNFYSTWDMDGSTTLSEREYTDGMFTQLDADGNGTMTATEYNNFNNRYFRF